MGAPGRVWAEVDLGAIRHNVCVLRRRSRAPRLMAVVKADAYGHGAVPVARATLAGGADGLAVATAAEGAELRRAGIRAPILVFGDPSPVDLRLAARERLAVSAHSIPSARRIAALGVEVHLKVDTGMNRWGLEPAEVGEALRALGRPPEGVYTHLACADSDPEATRRQLETFDAVLAAHSFGGALVHAANSAATLWHPDAHYDCVRPGIALYGLHPAGDAGDPGEEGLRPALALKSRVAAVRRLEPGEGVSYGLTFRAPGPMLAATVPVGYADGYRRALSGRAEALVRGRRRPLLGRVSMDACVFGVDGDVRLGDEVVLLGRQGDEVVTAEELAAWAGTINYEITTGLNPRRVERSYADVQGS
ncbi:Alanine racemase [Rubrobacter xylanophilus DSM 9941]|uniref:alanine racemase n=1 Tax=Rubrobacter xylanophilus TaxID=49319 RepID=UPI001C640026|nr:alanine racemase [Rubrobacter xylanophilus]QYJ17003.1 Alanine racemase [Rubrobacter xylanophilus DSM 9941]